MLFLNVNALTLTRVIINMNTFEHNHPHYLNIPYFILQDQRLDFFNKFLFSLLWSFSVSGKQITASNSYIASLFKVSERYVQMRLMELQEMHFIRRYNKKAKRYIEVLYIPKADILNQDMSSTIGLVRTAVHPNTKPDQKETKESKTGRTTVRAGGELQFVAGANHSSPNIKDNNKDIIKPTPLTGESELLSLLTLENLTAENPHKIEPQLINEWLQVRKKRKSPVTPTAWNRVTNVLTKLVSAGLSANDCFERMVANGWQSLEYRYFEKDIKQTTVLKYPTPEERQINEQQIRERELRARQEKEKEIQSARNFSSLLGLNPSEPEKKPANRPVSIKELLKKQQEEMNNLGMTAVQYHAYITNVRNICAPQPNCAVKQSSRREGNLDIFDSGSFTRRN